MDVRVFVDPMQGATYDDELAVARLAEELGFSAYFRSDHYLAMTGDGLPGPTDAWTSLAGLARETSTIRLGTMMTSATFRHPGPLAIAVAQVDRMSGGRVELGLGAGWYAAEHAAYGIPFPESLGERFDRFEEQLEIVTGLWRTPLGSTFDHAGPHHRLTGSPALPKPVQAGGPPVIIGGHGKRRTPALAARFAAEFNVPFASPATTRAAGERVRAACEAEGRDPGTMVFSNAHILCCATNPDDLARRTAAVDREAPEILRHTLRGTPAQVLDALGAYADAGSDRAYLRLVDLADLDQLRLVAAEVLPHL